MASDAAPVVALRDHALAIEWLAARGRIRPAGWSDQATAGLLNTASGVLRTVADYDQASQRLDVLRQTAAAQQEALNAQLRDASAYGAGSDIAAQIRLRIAREALERTRAEEASVAAQVRASASLAATPIHGADAAPTPSPQRSVASGGSGGVSGAAIAGGAAAIAAVVAIVAWASSRRKRR